MFSEPLTISQIIRKLKDIKEKHGDICVGTWNDGILRFIRSIRYIEAKNTNKKACVLQWFDDIEE